MLITRLLFALSASFVIAPWFYILSGDTVVVRGLHGPAPDAPVDAGLHEVSSAPPNIRAVGNLNIDSLSHYSDTLYAFDVAVPTGWQRIVTIDEDTVDDAASDWSYAVGFESKMSHTSDRYADYVMIEVMPGAQSGGFVSSGRETEAIVVDGRPAVRDRIWLDSIDLHGDELTLVVYQAMVSGLGFNVGLYAIGEQRESEGLGMAFDALLHTFTLHEEPYTVF